MGGGGLTLGLVCQHCHMARFVAYPLIRGFPVLSLADFAPECCVSRSGRRSVMLSCQSCHGVAVEVEASLHSAYQFLIDLTVCLYEHSDSCFRHKWSGGETVYWQLGDLEKDAKAGSCGLLNNPKRSATSEPKNRPKLGKTLCQRLDRSRNEDRFTTRRVQPLTRLAIDRTQGKLNVSVYLATWLNPSGKYKGAQWVCNQRFSDRT